MLLGELDKFLWRGGDTETIFEGRIGLGIAKKPDNVSLGHGDFL